MDSVEIDKLIAQIQAGKKVHNSREFEEFSELFLNIDFENRRKNLYQQIMDKEGYANLAVSKNAILKQLFADYIILKLEEANTLNSDHNEFEAKYIVEKLETLRDIFKLHDIVNFQEFISQADPKISETEAILLFLKPTLTPEELDNITNAIVVALGKKHENLNNKADLQSKFFNHPLINCLNAYESFNSISLQVENNKFEFGYYENLIKTIIKINTKEMNEEYQGFISFLIKEDLSVGFSKILKDENYSPKYLRELLKKITSGVELDDKSIKELILEIKNDHTKNLKLDSNKLLKENISSKHSLNDYGFYMELNNEKIFFHGHETNKNGVAQNKQQSNTALILRNFDLDTIGLTVLGHNVTRDEQSRCWVNSDGFKGLLKLTKLEEVMLTGLQFDAQHIKTIVLRNDENKESLMKGNFLNSNHYIVKSDIKRSKKIINFNVGKNDLELIIQKKNAYLNIFKNNIDFFTTVLGSTSTNNQAQYQLISEPFLDLIISIKDIEDNAKINIFTKEDTQVFKQILDPVKDNKFFNTDIGTSIRLAYKYLRLDNDYEQVKGEFNQLTQLISNDEEKIHINQIVKTSKYDNDNAKLILKAMKNKELSDVINTMDNHPLSENCSKHMKTKIIKELEYKIDDECERLYENYRSDKAQRMIGSIKYTDGITRSLSEANDLNFNVTDYIKSHSNEKTMSDLLKDPKEINITLLKGLCHLAELSGAKINCSGIPLKNKLNYRIN